MQPRILIDEAQTPGGETMTLTSRSGYFLVSVEGYKLMSSSEHHSEEHMAAVACPGLATHSGARLAIGGLGMGFTLRATLDQMPPDGEIVVVEVMQAVVKWNRGPLAHLSENALDDPRVEVVLDDAVRYFSSRPEPFDGILLDVDNGPEAFTLKANDRLYSLRGLRRLRDCLRPGGALVIWSAFDSPEFVQALRKAGFDAESVQVRSRGKKGRRHTLFVGRV